MRQCGKATQLFLNFLRNMSSYDPSQWYSYSKNRPNELPNKPLVFSTDFDVASSSKADDEKQLDEDAPLKSEVTQPPEQHGSDEVQSGAINMPNVSGQVQLNSSKMNNFVKRLQKMVRELPR